ncbi:hypothetical protein EB796_021217 [Bugula neritina]|uniref:Uncharacterized protein n=1 Tax=Bugula neritina TaxID=10212 RepID=A0A7J7J479_BUGNE|nr:hypothetical protein EB796_021217 [Bugula neritina]
MPTIAQAIEKEEDVITEYEGLINEINHQLRVKNLTKEARDELESELRQLIKKKNMTGEYILISLRKNSLI